MAMGKGKTSNTLVWILMAMLILGLGGFGVTNLSGTIRTVGTVGDKEIDINEYARGLQETLAAAQAETGRQISLSEAQIYGLDRQILSQMILQRALDAETSRIGLSVGDETLQGELFSIPQFRGLDGNFDREAYSYFLNQRGMSDRDFEARVREETVRSLLQGAVAAGVVMPDSYTQTIMGFVGERRSFTWARLGADALDAPVGPPTATALQDYYDANIADFTRPATKQIEYVQLTPEMILDSVEVPAEDIAQQYEARIDEFVQPERRLVERLIYGDAAQAQAAYDRLMAGEASFENLVEERGLSLLDVDMGDMARSDLGAAADGVFAVQAGGVTAPLPTDLGPALFRINGVIQASETTLDAASDSIREELAIDRARRVIDAQFGEINDLLAAGATMDELASETDMVAGVIDWHAGLTDGVAAYDEFRDVAAAATTDDFAEALPLGDGGLFAMQVLGTTDATPAPFDEVETDVAVAWRDAETRAALMRMGEGFLPSINATSDFATLGLTAQIEEDLKRNDFLPETPPALLFEAFEMETGEVRLVQDADSVLLLRLDAIADADPTDPQILATRAAIAQQGSGALSQDIFEAYARALQGLHPVLIDQQAINAVHAQFQ